MKELISIADKSKTIPKTKKSQNTSVKPWFDNCKDAIKTRKKDERQSGKHPHEIISAVASSTKRIRQLQDKVKTLTKYYI
jgi:site-specific recombinase